MGSGSIGESHLKPALHGNGFCGSAPLNRDAGIHVELER